MGIIALGNAKQQLNITNTNHDEELQGWIDAASRIVEYYIGPAGEPAEFTQVVSGGECLVLSRTPVASVTSIDPVYTVGLSYNPSDLDIDNATGIVRHKLGWSFFGPLRVVYTAGRSTVPANADAAARIIVQHLWQTRRGGSRRPGMSQSDDIVEQQIVSVMGYAIPRRAVELLQPDQAPGIA